MELGGIGPAMRLGPVEFAERLNLVTGDNGLGKTFLLDIGWWALTGTWVAREPWPRNETTREEPPYISSTVAGKTTDAPVHSAYDFDARKWSYPAGRPPMPGLVLYFRGDGCFSLWDPAQHYWTKSAADERVDDAFHFTLDSVWDGIMGVGGQRICRGLIEDWVTWQQTGGLEFQRFQKVLAKLSPSPKELLTSGTPLAALALDATDRRQHPTLQFGHGTVPAVLASAGMKRILSLAYLVVWAWQGHELASAARKQDPEQRMVILFDEPETHLHPQWQRRILPALFAALAELRNDLRAQILVATHSPLILASVESLFDAEKDRLFHLEICSDEPPTNEMEEFLFEEPRVEMREVPFAKEGDASAWLSSDVFGLTQARSLEAERAITAAQQFQLGSADGNPEGLRTRGQIDDELKKVLAAEDPFWPRWVILP